MNNLIKFVFLSLIDLLLLDSVHCNRCCAVNFRKVPPYKLSKSGAYSDEEVISRKAVRGLNECKRFAISKKALAFNFGLNISPNGSRAREDTLKRNTCQILQCPEMRNLSSLIKNKNYRYYSIYPNYIPSGEGTVVCVPKAGIFILSSNKLNFTEARKFCQQLNGSLAHIISEERTSGLAKFTSYKTPRYVGLSNNDDENIWKNAFGYEPLSCFKYRAWGTGEPSNSRGCVAIVTSSNTRSLPFWKAVPCYVSLPFICEIFPTYR